MAGGELCATVAPRTYRGVGESVSVGRWGLLVRRRWRWPRRIWWEEVRRVEWLEHGRVRLWLAVGSLELDERLTGLRELVATVEAAAGEVRGAWRAGCDGRKACRLLGLHPGAVLTLPTGTTWRRVLARGGVGLRTLVTWALDFAFFYGIACLLSLVDERPLPPSARALAAATAVPLVRLRCVEHPESLPGNALWALFTWLWRAVHPARAEHLEPGESRPGRVALSLRGVWLDGRCRPWAQVRGCDFETRPGATTALVTLAGEDWRATFPLWRCGARRAGWLFRVLADLTRHEFVGPTDEPPPATALSLTRLSGDHEADRGLSLTADEGH